MKTTEPQSWRVIANSTETASYMKDRKRIQLPPREYTMTENCDASYHFVGHGIACDMPFSDVAQYKESGALKFPENHWP